MVTPCTATGGDDGTISLLHATWVLIVAVISPVRGLSARLTHLYTGLTTVKWMLL